MTSCPTGKPRIAVVACLLAAIPAAGSGQERTPPAAFAKVGACRAITDDVQRLACFDREVGAISTAIAEREVAIVDRAEIRKTRRSLFGVPLPRIAILEDNDDAPELKEVTAAIRSVGRTSDGRLQFTLEDGASWVQTDDWPVWSAVKPGQKVTLKRGALGSYFADFEKAVSVRAKRLR